jgi:hypothetical protein
MNEKEKSAGEVRGGRPKYRGKSAQFHQSITVPNHSPAVSNTAILAKAKATESEFYRVYFQALAELESEAERK